MALDDAGADAALTLWIDALLPPIQLNAQKKTATDGLRVLVRKIYADAAAGDGGGGGGSGATGATGAAGSNGTNGATGATGTAGSAGAVGATGAAGATGTAGSAGAVGATGAAGTVGATGAGTTGATGAAGSNGTNGATGAAGAAGSTGATGAGGATGATGAGAWLVGYDYDFTSGGLSTAAGDGNFTIDSKTWTVTNFAKSSVMSVGGADGLRVKQHATAGLSSITPTNRTGPLFQSPSMATLLSGLVTDDMRFSLRISVYILSAARSTSGDASFMLLDTGSNNQRYEIEVFNSSGTTTDWGRLVLSNSTKSSGNITHLASHDCYQIEIPNLGGDEMLVNSGIYSAGWPTKWFRRAVHRAANSVWLTALMTAQSEAFYVLGIEGAANAGTSETKYGRMRIEYRLHQ